MRLFKLLGFGAIAVFASCHSAKKVTTSTPVKKDTSYVAVVKDSATLAKEVLANWQNNTLSYQTFSGKLGVSIKSPDLNQSVNANIRSTKDSLIWVSLTGPFNIEGARAKISADSAIVINKLNSTVEKRSIGYIQNIIHQPLVFADIQNILTGRMLLQKGILKSYKGNADGTWNFVFQQGTIQNQITLDPTNNWILQNQLTDFSNPARTCSVQYKNFQKTVAGWIPNDIHIVAKDKTPMDIELSYKQVNFNQTLDYPFNIPSKYSVRQ